MNEPDVTLTDYALALECIILAVLLLRGRGSAISRERCPGTPADRGRAAPADRGSQVLRRRFALFFGAVALASLAGGTVHGFFPDPVSAGYRVLWPLTLLAIGAAALAAWSVGLELQGRSRLLPFVTVAYGAYAVVVLLVSQRFLLAIAGYLPATIFLLWVLAVRYRRHREPGVGLGVAGLLLTFVAAAVQQAGIGLHPEWFDHNALYHVIQAVALLLIWRAALDLASSRESAHVHAT